MTWIATVREAIRTASSDQLVSIYATLLRQTCNEYAPEDHKRIPARSVYKDAELTKDELKQVDRIVHEMHVSCPPIRGEAIARLRASGLGAVSFRLRAPLTKELSSLICAIVSDYAEDISDYEIFSEDADTIVKFVSMSDLLTQVIKMRIALAT